MEQNTPNIVLKSIKLPPALHRQIKAESVERDENIDETVARAWNAYRQAAADRTSSPISPIDGNPIPAKWAVADQLDPDNVNEHTNIATSPQESQRWAELFGQFIEEAQQLKEILESGNAVAMTAIRSNLIAFRELVRRADEQARRDARPQSVPGGEVGSVHHRVTEHEQALVAEEAVMPRPANRPKRSRPAKEGVG